MPAVISSLFAIDIVETIASGASKTVTNPGRAFKIVQVLVTGANGAVCEVRKNTGAGAVAADTTLATGDLNGFTSRVFAADAVFAATDNIFVSAATAALSRVTLLCEAASGQDLTVA